MSTPCHPRHTRPSERHLANCNHKDKLSRRAASPERSNGPLALAAFARHARNGARYYASCESRARLARVHRKNYGRDLQLELIATCRPADWLSAEQHSTEEKGVFVLEFSNTGPTKIKRELPPQAEAQVQVDPVRARGEERVELAVKRRDMQLAVARLLDEGHRPIKGLVGLLSMETREEAQGIIEAHAPRLWDSLLKLDRMDGGGSAADFVHFLPDATVAAIALGAITENWMSDRHMALLMVGSNGALLLLCSGELRDDKGLAMAGMESDAWYCFEVSQLERAAGLRWWP